jgi:hypothetical protein
MNRAPRVLVALNVALLTCWSIAGSQWAPLPAGAVQTLELTSVTGEFILRNLLVPPESFRGRLPMGYRAWTLRDLESLHGGAAEFLLGHPDHTSDAVSTLSFLLFDSLKVDGKLQPGPHTVAFWWIPVVSARDSASLERPVGNVELAVWWSDPAVRRKLTPVWPPTAAAELRISPRDSLWEISLRRPDLAIQATCAPVGERAPAGYPLPAVDTLWPAGSRPEFYMLETYYGHMSRRCSATWAMSGTHLIAGAYARLRQLPDWSPATELLDGWRAQAAIYRP